MPPRHSCSTPVNKPCRIINIQYRKQVQHVHVILPICLIPLSLFANKWEMTSRNTGLYLNTCLLLHSGFVTFLYLQPEIKIYSFAQMFYVLTQKTYDDFKAFIINTTLETIFRVFSSQRPLYVECSQCALSETIFTDVFLVSIIPQVWRELQKSIYKESHQLKQVGILLRSGHERRVHDKFCMGERRIVNWDQYIKMSKIKITPLKRSVNVILCYKPRQKDNGADVSLQLYMKL